MIEHVWTVVCETSLINRDSNNFSFIEVIESINLPAPPKQDDEEILVAISFDVVSLWSRQNLKEPIKGKSKLKFLNPDSKLLHQQEYLLDLSNSPRARTRNRITSLPFKNFGTYKFIVELMVDGQEDWLVMCTIPLVVEQIKTAK